MSCPSEEQLAGYLLDSQAPDLASVREHVTTCATCRAWVEEVRQEDEDLQHVRRVLVQIEAATSAGISVQIGAGDATTFSPTAVFAASPDFQEYEIIEELGRGGMGAVYLATQKSTKRKVALKVLLEGPFASATSKRRFEREVELAAQLQHPHIVTILESGIASGRYYFAMQYVEGERLDVHFAPKPAIGRSIGTAASPPEGGRSDGRPGPARQGPTSAAPASARPPAAGSAFGRSDIAAKLRLFQQICEAVNYAHQRGVIHRDLKPSNILIDHQGEPHILDFGLAKVADPLAEKEPIALSITGQLMGTLPYMSPEQAMGLHHDLDVRSDVYSLGVILYELLTRQFPYTVAGRIPDVLKNIIETPPKAPSSLDAKINDEVETITLKTLCKERERRYQTAGELARDLGHYLAGEPIEAKRDSAMYVLGKMLRRYRIPVTVVGLFLLVVLIGSFMLTASRARARESQAALDAAKLLQISLDNPGHVLSDIRNVPRDVRRNLADLVARHLMSPAAPERVMGSPAGLLLRPDVFWASVDGGPLWEHGEWLEIAAMAASPQAGPPPQEMVDALVERAGSGSDRQKYIGLCLLGELWRQHPSLVAQTGNVFVRAAKTEPHPGVAAAGLWAAGRIGRQVERPLSQCLFDDEVSGLTFVRVPGCEQFRLGARPDTETVPIRSVHWSTTEVTLAAFEKFFAEFGEDEKLFGDHARGVVGLKGTSLAELLDTEHGESPEIRVRRAVNFVSLTAATRFCSWLSERGSAQEPSRSYRLPSEEEWEWACRGGNRGMFCYGDDATYLTFFAKSDGTLTAHYRVAERMPNYYGLFDMHGDVWEWTTSVHVNSQTGQPETDERGEPFYIPRGGAFYSPGAVCSSAMRVNRATRDAETEYMGFRIVMELLP